MHLSWTERLLMHMGTQKAKTHPKGKNAKEVATVQYLVVRYGTGILRYI